METKSLKPTCTLTDNFHYYTKNKQKQISNSDERQSIDFFSASSNHSKIQELSLDLIKKCFEFLPQELHPYFGFSLNIKSNFFWQDFLSSDWKDHFEVHAESSQKSYFEHPERRRLDLILGHKKSQKAIELVTSKYFQKTQRSTGKKIYFQKSFLRDDCAKTKIFFSRLIYDALKNTHSGFLNLEFSPLDLQSLSLEMFIEHGLSVFKNQIESMTENEKRNLSQQYIQELILQDIISLDEAKHLNKNALSCLANTTIQNLLEDQIITITELAAINPWKIAFALQAPLAENSIRAGHYTLKQLEIISDTCFFVFEKIILFAIFVNI
jgi:hypothetical protein